MRNLLSALFITLMIAAPACAELNIVATLPWIGSVVKEIGKDKVTVTTLVKPHQNPHNVEAKPSMILAVRKAELIMFNGLDLEIGYLPLLIEASRNSGLMPGKPGNFDCSRFVKVIERPLAVDRSMGDVHPLGNPHYYFSPANILRIAGGMTDRLAGMDGANAEFYRTNYKNFAERLKLKQKQWDAVPLKGKKFVAYHKLFEYLTVEYGFQLLGYLEPKPGIPPSAAHIEVLLQTIKRDRPDGILTTLHYGKKESESVSRRSGLKVIILPNDVGSMPGTDTWFAFMDKVLALLK
jgi:zinc/manganese transport system substrate-binding protein